MSKQIINLNQIANQSLSFDIGDYSFDMNLRTTDVGLFCDLSINDDDIFKGKRCVNLMPLILSKTLLTGNLYFEDRYGNDNPEYNEFNTRFQLIYDDEYII